MPVLSKFECLSKEKFDPAHPMQCHIESSLEDKRETMYDIYVNKVFLTIFDQGDVGLPLALEFAGLGAWRLGDLEASRRGGLRKKSP